MSDESSVPFVWQEVLSGLSASDYTHTNKVPPGTMLKLDTGKVVVVGDVNVYGGVCDCCRESGKVVAMSHALVVYVTIGKLSGEVL